MHFYTNGECYGENDAEFVNGDDYADNARLDCVIIARPGSARGDAQKRNEN